MTKSLGDTLEKLAVRIFVAYLFLSLMIFPPVEPLFYNFDFGLIELGEVAEKLLIDLTQ